MAEALHEIRVCREVPAECHQIGISAGNDLFRGLLFEAAGRDDLAVEQRSQLRGGDGRLPLDPCL